MAKKGLNRQERGGLHSDKSDELFRFSITTEFVANKAEANPDNPGEYIRFSLLARWEPKPREVLLGELTLEVGKDEHNEPERAMWLQASAAGYQFMTEALLTIPDLSKVLFPHTAHFFPTKIISFHRQFDLAFSPV